MLAKDEQINQSIHIFKLRQNVLILTVLENAKPSDNCVLCISIVLKMKKEDMLKIFRTTEKTWVKGD